ncbi:MAG: hypothetical protein IPP15_01890 [Saprospiraceae bacterium]|uniref:Uncharacterized protein n=1 Tax=Candidatus Opimibacter skivensis TaxID=2982028 RepID=A0A9D7XLJ1_9BACT|nr:hypothetical protein [Candidatus Opimibacter skivensis]
MREAKLYKALVQLDGHELNRLHKFITSPYFNRNQAIIKLFEWIKDDLKREKSTELSKEELWNLCFAPNEKYDDGRFRKLQSDLLKLVEEYYAQEAFEANPIHKAKYLLESIYNKDLEDLQSGTLKTAKRLAEEQILKPASFYYYQYEIEQNIFNLTRSQVERNAKSNIEEIAENLDRFYLAEKLRYYCTILNHQHLADLNYKMLFIDQIIQHVESNDYNDVPPIVIYHQILLSYKEPEERKHYDKIKKLIEEHIHLFPETEVAEILDSALNYCIKRMNSGEAEFVKEAFQLYQKWLDRGLLKVRGKIDPFHFKNIVTIGLRLKEFDWIEEFIHENNAFLDEKVRDNAVTFNLAQLYFYKKDYPKVISQLSQVEYDDITYNLNSKTLLMASYYELDEIEALGSLLDTFRVYLSRNKELPASRRKHYLSTISIVRKLSKIVPGDKKEIEKLQKEVDTTQGVVSKNWILEKLTLLNK